MTTETKSHIQFAPLILPRKTPAEEARQLRDAWANADINASNAVDCLVELIDRLETPDAPKRWDGVWPWVGEHRNTAGVVPHFSKDLRLIVHGQDHRVSDTPFDDLVGSYQAENQSPYHDGVIITITAGSGDEFPRIHQSGLNFYLVLAEYSFVVLKVEDCPALVVGQVCDSKASCNGYPLPPGTATRITINNTLPTTEQRYSVEVVEPEKPKFEPITIGDTIVSAGDNWVEADYGCSISAHRFPVARAREIAAALTAAANHLDPQEQPATVAVAEGLPLEFACLVGYEKIRVGVAKTYNRLWIDWGDGSVHFSPADEARLRNLLNQRAEGGAS